MSRGTHWSRRGVGFVVGGALVMGLAMPLHAEGLRIEEPWSRATTPAVAVGVGYMTIRNPTDEDDRLIAAHSPNAEAVEIHESMQDGEVMRMHPRPHGVEVPAGGSAVLEPGGLHLMLTGLKAPLKAGDKVPLTLVFETAGEVATDLDVRPLVPD